ncbi:MAG: VOC family protein [Kordiimonadaceae bacterium]|nr:VOC family protein [Kordiimonadaceae bacterium]MBO6568744.1 VOC family protein [Kordiimonadaceae bacterium]MBO6965280.1 VOC family protein [Kordiimonadaceae bacterium]
MIDHMSVGVECLDTAREFYTKVLQTLGFDLKVETSDLLAFGGTGIEFLAMKPFDKAMASAGNGMHVAFTALSEDQVDKFHAVAMELGATCEGMPGKRNYPHAEVYAAYVRDPFGHKLEALTNGLSAR